MTGGWGTQRKPVLDSIREYADDVRKRYREGTGLPPSNDPERPPKGPASGTLPKGPASVSAPVANPQRVQVEITLPPLDFTCTGCKCPHHQETTDDH